MVVTYGKVVTYGMVVTCVASWEVEENGGNGGSCQLRFQLPS